MMLAFAAYALQSCHSGGSTTTTTDSTTTDTSKKVVADTAKADTGDAKFAKALAGGGTAEITFSKLAEQKVAAGTLKEFAAMMVTDHTKAADTLMAIAAKENITLPTTMDADHQTQYDSMQKTSGDDFNKAYVNLMVADHTEAPEAADNKRIAKRQGPGAESIRHQNFTDRARAPGCYKQDKSRPEIGFLAI